MKYCEEIICFVFNPSYNSRKLNKWTNWIKPGLKPKVIKKIANVLKSSYYETQSNLSRSSHQELFLRKQLLSTGL